VTEQAYIDTSKAALDNMRQQGTTIRALADDQRAILARQIEPWVNQKAAEIEAKGMPGKKPLTRFVEISVEKGARPAHKYVIK